MAGGQSRPVRSENLKKAWHWALGMAAIAIGVACLFSGPGSFWFGTVGSSEVVPPGTVLTVRLAHALSSKTLRLGELFEGRIISTDSMRGTPGIPPGTRVAGRCVAVRKAEGQGHSGYLRLAISGLYDSQGNLAPVSTTTFSQWGDRPIGLASYSAPVATSEENAWGRVSESVAEQAGNSGEAVVTPEALLTFTLLEPVAMTGR